MEKIPNKELKYSPKMPSNSPHVYENKDVYLLLIAKMNE